MREFLTLVKCGSFTEAAAELYISQPTLTRHVNALEDELGCPLLVRTGHSVVLTPGGKLAMKAFEKVLGTYRDLLSDIERVAAEDSPDLTLGMLYYGTSAYYGYPLLEEFSKRYPEVRVSTIPSQSGQIYSQLRRGLIDVAVTVSDSAIEDEFERHVFATIPLYAFVATDNPLARRRSVTLEELAELPVILNHYSDSLRNNVETLFFRHGVELEHKVYLQHIDDLLITIARTGGVFVGSMLLTAIPQQHHAFVPIEADDFTIDVALVWPQGTRSELIDGLIEASERIRKPHM